MRLVTIVAVSVLTVLVLAVASLACGGGEDHLPPIQLLPSDEEFGSGPCHNISTEKSVQAAFRWGEKIQIHDDVTCKPWPVYEVRSLETGKTARLRSWDLTFVDNSGSELGLFDGNGLSLYAELKEHPIRGFAGGQVYEEGLNPVVFSPDYGLEELLIEIDK